MIVGLGLDLVELKRIRRSVERFGSAFAQRILHPEELKRLPGEQVVYLASRFAAKEAAVKALGTGFSGGITLQDVYVINRSDGEPELRFSGKALERFQILGAERAFLSITHGRDTAAAVVVLEKLA